MKINREKIEKLKEIKRLLIIIDMVNGFVKEGPLAAQSIERIVPHNKELIEEFINDKESCVFFIRDSHTADAVEFNTFPAHCIENSKESELIDELKEYEKDGITYLKNSTNFVFAPNFIEDMSKMNSLEEVILNGCLTDYCVKNGGMSLRNLYDQDNKNIRIIVDEAGVDTYDSPTHNREEEAERAIVDMTNNGIERVKKYGGK